MKNIFLILVCCFLLGCNPTIDEVSYAVYYKNPPFSDSTVHIGVQINTGKDFFKGRESFMSFKKQPYFITLSKIDTIYTEKDISIAISGIVDTVITPRYGRIRMREVDANSISVTIRIIDPLLPRLINGDYKLNEKDKNSNYIWYISD
jgi:hypothetical protein